MKRTLLPLLGCTTLLFAATAGAQNLTASSTTASINTMNHTSTVTFTPGADSGAFDFVLNFDNTEPASLSTTPAEVTGTVANGTINCNATASTVSCIASASSGTVDLGTGTVTILFDTGPTTGTAALTFGAVNFFNQVGGTEPGTTTNGSVTITPTPPGAPVLTFTPPAPGPITISASGAGSIAVSAGAGLAGSSTTLTCTSTNGTATVTGSPFAPNSSGSVAVQCTLAAAPAAFTVTCDPTQSSGPDQPAQVFNATCPMIVPVPEFTANLAVGLVGPPSTTVSGGSTITNTGTAPLTITCGAAPAGFTVTNPTSPIAPSASSTLGVSCTTSPAAGTTVTGNLTCTTNDADEGTVVFALSCSSQILSVPTMGNLAKGMMIALLAGLGLLGFAMRRRIV